MCHELHVRRLITRKRFSFTHIEPDSSATTTVHARALYILVFTTALNCIVFFERRAIDPAAWTTERERVREVEKSFAFVKCNRKLMVDVMKKQIAAPLLLLLLLLWLAE